MADNQLNTQLQALHARLDRVDEDLISQYAGVSQLVAGLAANPLTSGSVAPSLATFNFSSAGQTALKKLLTLVPGYNTFKALQHLDTTKLLTGLEASLKAQVGDMATQMANQVKAAVTAQLNAVAAQVAAVEAKATALTHQLNAAQALAAAQASGASQATIAQLTAAKAAADNVANTAISSLASAEASLLSSNSTLSTLNQTSNVLTGYIKTLTDIASGQTRSSIIRK